MGPRKRIRQRPAMTPLAIIAMACSRSGGSCLLGLLVVTGLVV